MKIKDILIAILVGEMVSFFILIIARIAEKQISWLWLSFIFLPLLCAFCLWLAYLVSFKIPVAFQFARFVLVGALNTMIDFGVLNILMFFSGITAGLGYSLFKSISAVFAMTNSFFWNKFWTFQKSHLEDAPKEAPRFFLVTLLGFLVNVSIASFVVNVIPAPENIGPKTWGNIGAGVAVLIGFLWNFLGYKFFAFKK